MYYSTQTKGRVRALNLFQGATLSVLLNNRKKCGQCALTNQVPWVPIKRPERNRRAVLENKIKGSKGYKNIKGLAGWHVPLAGSGENMSSAQAGLVYPRAVPARWKNRTTSPLRWPQFANPSGGPEGATRIWSLNEEVFKYLLPFSYTVFTVLTPQNLGSQEQSPSS